MSSKDGVYRKFIEIDSNDKSSKIDHFKNPNFLK